jgi:hypothetical protein
MELVSSMIKQQLPGVPPAKPVGIVADTRRRHLALISSVADKMPELLGQPIVNRNDHWLPGACLI